MQLLQLAFINKEFRLECSLSSVRVRLPSSNDGEMSGETNEFPVDQPEPLDALTSHSGRPICRSVIFGSTPPGRRYFRMGFRNKPYGRPC